MKFNPLAADQVQNILAPMLICVPKEYVHLSQYDSCSGMCMRYVVPRICNSQLLAIL